MNPRRPIPHISAAKCTGCGRCVGACGPHLLSLEVANWIKTARLESVADCTGCSKCSVVCPFGAISMIQRSVAEHSWMSEAGPNRNFNRSSPCPLLLPSTR
ncbi:MAG: 4Fe-4S dicluster domain-containing protein [Burkholderiales bacterium]|nr:4Fe-4S dicluster domain-containing protein [Burkholderiales bacterium]